MRTKKRLKKAGWIAFFVTPALGVVFAFILLPLFMSLFNSLFSWNQLIRSDYTGFRNFEDFFLLIHTKSVSSMLLAITSSGSFLP